MGSVTSKSEECTALARTRGADHHGARLDASSLSEKDFYELFELERYSGDRSREEFKARVNRKFRQLALLYHPDRSTQENRAEHEAVFKFLETARSVLLDPNSKWKYDQELRHYRGEDTGLEALRWWCRWVFNLCLLLGGIGLLTAGLCSAVAIPLSIAGSAMLSAGMRGASSQCGRPDQSDYSYLKEVSIGALTGTAGGAIGGICAGAIEAVDAVVQISTAAAGGGAIGIANHIIEDVVNLADGSVSTEEVFTVAHTATVCRSVAFGMAMQGVASSLPGDALTGQQIVDTAADVAVLSGRKAADVAIASGKRVLDAIIATAERVRQTLKARARKSEEHQAPRKAESFSKSDVDRSHAMNRSGDKVKTSPSP